jgi:hypothetical protein
MSPRTCASVAGLNGRLRKPIAFGAALQPVWQLGPGGASSPTHDRGRCSQSTDVGELEVERALCPAQPHSLLVTSSRPTALHRELSW